MFYVPIAAFLLWMTVMNHFTMALSKMRTLRQKTIEAPRLTTEAQMREYVETLQRARVELYFHVRSRATHHPASCTPRPARPDHRRAPCEST